MKTENPGATKRRTLSLPFGRKRETGAALPNGASATIPSDELRRLVAAMID